MRVIKSGSRRLVVLQLKGCRNSGVRKVMLDLCRGRLQRHDMEYESDQFSIIFAESQ